MGESGEKRNHTDKKKILWAGKKHVLSIGGRDQIIRDSACEMRALERTSMKRGAHVVGLLQNSVIPQYMAMIPQISILYIVCIHHFATASFTSFGGLREKQK